MKTLTAVVFVLLFSFAVQAQQPAAKGPFLRGATTKAQAQPKLVIDSAQQCADLGGTWSNFKGRCDQTHKHFFKDKQELAALAVIAADGLIQGIQVNRTRTGGTFLFGGHGPDTTSTDIAVVESLQFAAMLGFQRLNWYLGHDDPSPVWRELSYWLIPTGLSGTLAYTEATTNWNHDAGSVPFSSRSAHVDMTHVQIKH